MNDAFEGPIRTLLYLLLGAALMAVVPATLETTSASDVPAMWWAARSFGLVAYLSLWLSMLFGVLVSSRGGGGLLHRATLLQLHQKWAVASLVVTSLHVLSTMADAEYGVTPLALLWPLASETQTGEIGLGTFALWTMVTIASTTAFFDTIPRWAWRAVHATAFGAYVLALVHGFTAGTDTAAPVVRATYAGTSAILLATILQRILLAWTRRQMRRRRAKS